MTFIFGATQPMSHTSASAFSRRDFLAHSALGTAALASTLSPTFAAEPSRKPRVAAIFTELRFRSHAYNILENFFEPYMFGGELVDPGVEVVSFYADQFPNRDMARAVSKKFKVPLFDSIGDAMRVGGKKMNVDSVLLIGEHGDYPYNKLGQKMYPRKRFFDAIVATMKDADRFVPIFNDKHLSYRWDWAKEMYDTAKRFGIPFQAGSSVPLAQRMPAIELPPNADIEEAVSIHGGGFESYDFHGLEVLQSFVEGRKGGESGVSKVQLLVGDEVERAFKAGRISRDLVDAAMQAETDAKFPRIERPSTGKAARKPVAPQKIPNQKRPSAPHALAIEYEDGFRAAVLKVGSSGNRWNFACRLKGEKKPQATALYNGPWGNRCLFKALSHSIQHLFRTRTEPYPIERTLLVSGILEAAVKSFNADNKSLATPHLEFAYQPIDFSKQRENGGSWKRITTKTPQPIDFSPGDAALVKGSK
jgi:hypothetical protein